MKLRRHCSTLQESLETIVEIPATKEAIMQEVVKYTGQHLPLDRITVEEYFHDKRIDWDTHIVYIVGYGVYGFTDGPLQAETGELK